MEITIKEETNVKLIEDLHKRLMELMRKKPKKSENKNGQN